jgi:hypothetical protein
MGTDKLIEQELPQWTRSVRRHVHYAQSIETEELADAELDEQLGIIEAIAAKPASSPLDMLVKLKLWEAYVAPDGEHQELTEEARLILSVIGDLEAFIDTDGASMATYPDGQLARVN